MNALQARLLDRNIVNLNGDVNPDMIEYVRECLAELEAKDNPPIRIDITSNGGSVTIGLLIHDYLRLYKGRKTGRVLGFARSMGAIILQACDERECTKNSMILIHHVNIGDDPLNLDTISSPKLLKQIQTAMEADQEKLYKILKARTHMRRKEITRLCKEDRNMPAKEAKKLGLIDKII